MYEQTGPSGSSEAARASGDQESRLPPIDQDLAAKLHEPPRDGGITHAGYGLVEVQKLGGQSVVVRQRATDPLRLLCPPRKGQAAWTYVSSYGGGLVAGDDIDLSVDVGEDALAVLTTQASTRIYRRDGDRACRQRVYGLVRRGGMLAVLPDPLTCHAGSSLHQQQRYDLAPGSSLVLLDWLTSGRRSGTERWAFHRYISRISVHIGDRRVLLDIMRLTDEDGALASVERLGSINCLGTLVLAGPAVQDTCDDLVRAVEQRPLAAGDSCLCAASRTEWGAVLRLAGAATEPVGREVVQHLGFLRPLLGSFPWDRKW